jgi:hypothetical protein
VVAVGCLTGAVGHGQDGASADGAGQLDDLVDLLLGGAQFLRTCEVGNCSRFAVQRKHQSEMDKFFRLRIECSASVNVLEVRRELLVCSEVWCPFREIWHVQQATTTRSPQALKPR